MSSKTMVLDCTLRDGAYITNSQFGDVAIRGIILKMQEAGINVIEVGWLKDNLHEEGSSYFHTPKDMEQYFVNKDSGILYTTMIDWDRYDIEQLPEYDGKTIDAVRVVFPHGKHREGIMVGEKIRTKGYRVMFQAANTLAYDDDELSDLATCMNIFKPVSLSIVDTFGAMYFDDLDRITGILDQKLDPGISLGFHAHNNQQLAFALCIHFVEMMRDSERSIMVDASLSGMGRGAGNATTELVTSYLNRKHGTNYELNAVMDAIDIYMMGYQEKYTWGYSTPYFIAGMYQCHVNNIAFLMKNHRTNAHDMREIIESLSVSDRRKYDYDLLERKYMENQFRRVDDEKNLEELKNNMGSRTVLLIAPGKSVNEQKDRIQEFIKDKEPLTIAVNALNSNYECDYALFINRARYEYAKSYSPGQMAKIKTILFSNIKTEAEDNDIIINYERVVVRGWEHFDNAVIMTLRLLNAIGIEDVSIAGFDGFKTQYNESYADPNLPTLNPENKWDELNQEISDMFQDFKINMDRKMHIQFLTNSCFAKQQ